MRGGGNVGRTQERTHEGLQAAWPGIDRANEKSILPRTKAQHSICSLSMLRSLSVGSAARAVMWALDHRLPASRDRNDGLRQFFGLASRRSSLTLCRQTFRHT